MDIFHRKKPEFSKMDKGTTLEFYLDESLLRMVLKYKINVPEFIKEKLFDEIHSRAIIRDSIVFQQGEK